MRKGLDAGGAGRGGARERISSGRDARGRPRHPFGARCGRDARAPSNGLAPREGRTPRNKEWYSRGYLPHFDHANVVQMITFRLADALPRHLLDQLDKLVIKENDPIRRKRIEACLDAGHGRCALHDPRVGSLVEETLLHFDGQRYRLIEWVVMPNHVHLLAEFLTGFLLPEVLQSWKSFSAHEANRILGCSGRFWQEEYFDRYIRDGVHFENARRYIRENPVHAGLVTQPEDWPYGSASWVRRHPGSADVPVRSEGRRPSGE
ncbi:MAG: transposase [Acidobacteriota bacterium]